MLKRLELVSGMTSPPKLNEARINRNSDASIDFTKYSTQNKDVLTTSPKREVVIPDQVISDLNANAETFILYDNMRIVTDIKLYICIFFHLF